MTKVSVNVVNFVDVVVVVIIVIVIFALSIDGVLSVTISDFGTGVSGSAGVKVVD